MRFQSFIIKQHELMNLLAILLHSAAMFHFALLNGFLCIHRNTY